MSFLKSPISVVGIGMMAGALAPILNLPILFLFTAGLIVFAAGIFKAIGNK